VDEDWGESFLLRNEITKLNLENGFVAEHDGQVVGFCHYKEEKEAVAKTTLLVVLPAYRRHGFGKALQEARMREAHEAGFRQLTTCCEHPSSQAWYKKHFGYARVGSEPVLHRLYFFDVGGTPIWAIHYGFPEYKMQEILVCDLDAFFRGTNV